MTLINNLFKTVDIAQYIVVVQPPTHAYKCILDIKQQFAKTYNCPQAIKARPHILLLKFNQLAMQEVGMVQKLQKQIAKAKPFSIQLNGYGSQPTHSIYMQVQTKNKLQELTNSLKPLQSFLQLSKEHKPFFITEPYLTVAKKLLPWQYSNAWLEYSQQHFTCSFMVSELLLLKLNIKQQHFSIAATMQLLGKQESIVQQVSLF